MIGTGCEDALTLRGQVCTYGDLHFDALRHGFARLAALVIPDLLAPWRDPPSAEQLIDEAQRRSGLSDFGDTPFMRPMQLLLQACREEAELSLFGAAAIRWDTVRFLTNLLRLRDEEKRCPEILDQSIETPLIIAGLPRSGTTFLHSLLIEDRANIVPRVWQLIYPYPTRRDQRGGSTDRRRQQVARQLRMFQILAPQFRRLHPIEASSPQECSEITAHIFASLRFDTTYRIPSYRRWLDGAGHLDAYRFHKRFLQHLQHQLQRSWALGPQMPRSHLRARCPTRSLSRCKSRLCASRSGRGVGLGRKAHRGIAPALQPPSRPVRCWSRRQ